MASPTPATQQVEPIPDEPCRGCGQPMSPRWITPGPIPAVVKAWYMCTPCGMAGWVDWINVDDTADGA